MAVTMLGQVGSGAGQARARIRFALATRGREEELERFRELAADSIRRAEGEQRGAAPIGATYVQGAETIVDLVLARLAERGLIDRLDAIDYEAAAWRRIRCADFDLALELAASPLTDEQRIRTLVLVVFAFGELTGDRSAERVALRILDFLDERVARDSFEWEMDSPDGATPMQMAAYEIAGAAMNLGTARGAMLTRHATIELVRAGADAFEDDEAARWASTIAHYVISDCGSALSDARGGLKELERPDAGPLRLYLRDASFGFVDAAE